MCHHLPAMESEAEVVSVSCPGDSLQRPRLFSPPADLCTDKSCSLLFLDVVFCFFARLHYWQNIEFEPFELALISVTNLMMASVVDFN